MLLSNITLQGKSIDFADVRDHEGANVITILMGNNGTGKSRIFQAICSTFIKASRQNSRDQHYLNSIVNISDLEQLDSLSYIKDGDFNAFSNFKKPFLKQYNLGSEGGTIELLSIYPYEEAIKNNVNDINVNDVNIIDHIIPIFLNEAKAQNKVLEFKRNGLASSVTNIPNKVLAVTGSPYDKFPFRDKHSGLNSLAPYVYLGTREKRQVGARFNRGYLSYKFDQLGTSFIKLLLKPRQEYFDFSKMFNFLDISHNFTLKLSISERVTREEINQKNILNLVRSVKFFKDKDHEEISEENERTLLSKRLVDAITYVAGEKLDKNKNPFEPLDILCKIDLGNEHKDKDLLNSLVLLSEYDLVELDDVIFTKSKSKQDFLLSQASSGELSLLFTMSSIAGEIENGSLILIDEPELSLHPEWQLNFLSLLTDIFSNYKNCHFIIATHSPNIISSIPDNNAYIVSLDINGAKLISSKRNHNRSADFQLASIFNAPGNNNEYLLNQVIEVLDNLCKTNEFDDDYLIRAKWLLTFDDKLEDGDKVKMLLAILKQTMEALNIR